MPLRLAIEASKETWTWKQFENLMDHQMERKENKEEWNMFEKEVIIKYYLSSQARQYCLVILHYKSEQVKGVLNDPKLYFSGQSKLALMSP